LRSQSKELVVKGSLAETSRQNKLEFAEAFLTVDAILVVDISASMAAQDVPVEAGVCRSRWEEANNQLKHLQARYPGRLAIVAFSNDAAFMPGGVLPPVQSSTDLTGALQFVRPADGCGIKFIVASDGEPDNPMTALDVARTMTPIDAIHIGTSERGRRFMEMLAKASGGQSVDTSVDLLEDVVVKLLGDGSK
jgi:Mg-chelatase subunit ChlD